LFRILKLFTIFFIITALAQGMIFADRKPAKAESYAAPCSRDAELSATNCREEYIQQELYKLSLKSKLREKAGVLFKENSRTFKIGDVEYTKDQLVQDFIRIAFPRYLWVEDMPLSEGMFYTSPVYNAYSKYDVDDRPEWNKEYIKREKGMPDFGGINRWGMGEITVSVGWPSIPVDQPRDPEIQRKIEDVVQKLSSKIKPVTGKSLRFVHPESETPELYARLRIVPYDIFYRDNKFKSRRRFSYYNPNHAPLTHQNFRSFEMDLRGAVRFTPMSRAQVEGYFIPAAKNEIDFAVCEIWPEHKDDQFQSLLTECLVRALGLPEVSIAATQAAVGPWNAVYDAVSKREILDGPEVNQGVEDRLFKMDTAEKRKKYMDYLNALLVPGLLNQQHVLSQPTAYDYAMLKMLYCDELSAGMGRYEILEVFYKSDKCFAF
jgi:hypothetical protein